MIAFIFALGIMSALKVAQEEKRVLLYLSGGKFGYTIKFSELASRKMNDICRENSLFLCLEGFRNTPMSVPRVAP